MVMEMRKCGFVSKIVRLKRVWVEIHQTGHPAKQQGAIAGFGTGTGVELIPRHAIFFSVVMENAALDIQLREAVVGADPQHLVVVAALDAASVVVRQTTVGAKPFESFGCPIISGHAIAFGGDPDIAVSVGVDVANKNLW